MADDQHDDADDLATPVGPACQECGLCFVPGQTRLKLGDGTFRHGECFVCHWCRGLVPLSHPFSENGRLYHIDCFPLPPRTCYRCRQPLVEGSECISVAGLKWHPQCFTCKLCGKLLEADDDISFRYGDVYHNRCLGPLVPERGFFRPSGECVMRPMARIVPVAPTQLLSDFPRVVTLPNFLTSEECAHVRDIVRSSLNPSELGTTRLNVSGMKSDARTSTSAFIDQSKDAVIRAIEERVAHVVAVPHSHVGRLHVGHYSPGQRFAIHYDALTKAEMKVQTNGFTRIATVLVYLNTMHCDGKVTQDVQGPQYRTNYEFVAKKASELCPSPSNGHTQFPMLGVSVAPVEGTAIYFQNVDQDWERIAGSLHSGAPVCCNEKWVMNAWCYNQPLYEGMIARYTDEGEEADIKDGESIAGKGL